MDDSVKGRAEVHKQDPHISPCTVNPNIVFNKEIKLS